VELTPREFARANAAANRLSSSRSGSSSPALSRSSSSELLLHTVPVHDDDSVFGYGDDVDYGYDDTVFGYGDAVHLANDNNAPAPAAEAESDLDALMRHATVAAYKTFAFHATKTKNIQGKRGIGQTGLDPGHGGTGAASSSATQAAASQQKVHYTRRHDHAQKYEGFLQGVPFGGRVHPRRLRGPAEMLQLNLTSDVLASQAKDPDDQLAFTTTQAISPNNIQRLKPKDLKAARAQGRRGWQEHDLKGVTALDALKSNLSDEGRAALQRLVASGHNETELMQMVKQGLLANPAVRFHPAISPESQRTNHPYLSAAGPLLPPPRPK
jgi:hypothetical protein